MTIIRRPICVQVSHGMSNTYLVGHGYGMESEPPAPELNGVLSATAMSSLTVSGNLRTN